MNIWKVLSPKTMEKFEIKEDIPADCAKVKLTRILLDEYDSGMYSGLYNNINFPIVLGSQSVGIISEIGENSLGLAKGQHVVIDNYHPCGQCLSCITGDTANCAKPLILGSSEEGLLRDFVVVKLERLYVLPPHIKDDDAVYANAVSLSLKAFLDLEMTKGEYVLIIGTNMAGVILAQIAQYYKSIPVLIGNNPQFLTHANSAGVNFVINTTTENIQTRIKEITSNNTCKSIAFTSDGTYPLQQAFELCSNGGKIAIIGKDANKNNTPQVSLCTILKKHLTIKGINNGNKQLPSAINLIANKAVDLTNFIGENASFDTIQSTLNRMSEGLINSALIKI